VLETTLLVAGSLGTIAIYIWRHFWFVACQPKDKE